MKALVGGLGALLLVGTMIPTSAEAQRGRTLERIEDLEEQIRDLQGLVYGEDASGAPVRFRGANPDGGASVEDASELLIRIGTIEQELQRLTGQMEQLSFRMRQQEEAMRRLINVAYPDYEGEIGLGLDDQADVVDGGGALDPVTGGPAQAGGPVDLVGGGSGADDALPSFRDAESAYGAGRSALLEARYAEAERAFLALLDQFPDSDRAGDAMYYLGETYLAQGDSRAAAQAYIDFLKTDDDHPRAAEAHLKLGQSFARLNATSEACQVWRRGLRNYPDMDDQLRRRMTDMREATCTS